MDTETLAARDRPTGVEEEPYRRDLLGDGHPHVHPRAAGRGDAACRERAQHRLTARRVRGLRATEEPLHLRIAPEADDEPLQDVAHPAGADQLPAFDARDRRRVAAHHGKPQIGAEGFRHRAHDRPASEIGSTERHCRAAGDGTRVIVLDDEGVGMAREHAA